MFKSHIAICALAVTVSACGAGGGAPASELDLVLLDTAPSESVLCSFVLGQTTTSDVLDTLGEPTHYSDSTIGAELQYWIGSAAELGTGLVPMVVFGFDAAGTLETPWVQEVPFPQCWRDQAIARDARRLSER